MPRFEAPRACIPRNLRKLAKDRLAELRRTVPEAGLRLPSLRWRMSTALPGCRRGNSQTARFSRSLLAEPRRRSAAHSRSFPRRQSQLHRKGQLDQDAHLRDPRPRWQRAVVRANLPRASGLPSCRDSQARGWRQALPELPCDGVAAAVSFYRIILGFRINYHEHDLGVMDRDAITLLLIGRRISTRASAPLRVLRVKR